jgi:hypothetical protein
MLGERLPEVTATSAAPRGDRSSSPGRAPERKRGGTRSPSDRARPVSTTQARPERTRAWLSRLLQFTKATPRYTVPYVGPTTTWNDSLATAPVIVVAFSLSVITTTLFGSAPWSPEALDVDVVA